ncbi:SIS domain-containing protein [Comamonas aquatica]|jgi:D-sedoheptulose 7-phosphate isomerase|uniref:Phosphoheptose isomerase n=2 Tax=Comamonas aquatica TaxID=225991 RepID=A0A014Q9X2_9BURK|nr:SIS domain-containing protein [Comamonas aquatica]ANY61292.1 phosphoheptose isomerase [Comamonas aquatica]EXU79992.1 phosphoheptose isomerase [Comamonas aquatica DA1877]MDE1554612.1 SIS domain-containing protein [Comamonas aquatica]MDH0199682.1 SIS domain-containing protein [Comamonas aquatica]MDH0363810.1 SIS domain-containing protein [Comamonas aquatica]
MLEQRIQQHFIDSADLKYQSAQSLSAPISAAVQALLACITGGGKILACGAGVSASQAQMFASLCVSGFERDRPELAAVALSADSGFLASVSGAAGLSAHYLARQVRALGQASDVLLAISITGNDHSLLEAVEAAHERDMMVVVLTGHTGGALAARMRETDVLICVPHERPARVRETHDLVLNCLCDGVDTQLLGEQEM